jgi:hypothetical protein
MTIPNLLKSIVSLGMFAIALKAAHYAYVSVAVGMRGEAVIQLLAASLALGFALFLCRVIDHYTTKKKRV